MANVQAEMEWWQRRRAVYQIDADEAARYGDESERKIWADAVVRADARVQKLRLDPIGAK